MFMIIKIYISFVNRQKQPTVIISNDSITFLKQHYKDFDLKY